MKKNKTYLISATLFSTYLIYIIIKTIYYLINKQTYGDVYFEFMFYPHLIFLVIANVLNYILFFKDNKYVKYIMILCYIISIIFLFINK